MNKEEQLKNRVNNVLIYGTYGNLNQTEYLHDNLISLKELSKDIKSSQKHRNKFIKIFNHQIYQTLKDNNFILKNNPLNERQLFVNSYLNLDLSTNDHHFDCYFSKNGLEATNGYGTNLAAVIPTIIPYIKELFYICEKLEKNNILNNEFYNQITLTVYRLFNNFIINGDGIYFDFSYPNDTETKDFDINTYYYVLDKYFQNPEKLFPKILLYDDSILDRYRLRKENKKVLKLKGR